MLVKRNTSAGRAGIAPVGRDERREVSCEGKMTLRLTQYVVMRRKRVGPVSRDRVGAQDTRKEDES